MSTEVSTRRLCAAMLLLALGFTSLVQTGCTRPIRRLGIVDEIAIAFRDQVWAQRAYNLRFANCGREFEDHFRNGFIAGYSDVCNGGDGFEPALPPEAYRGFEFQCAEGSNCVASWYEGYPEGVAAARAEDAGSYHKLHVSRMVDRAIAQDESPNLLPSEVPVTKPKAPPIPKSTVAAKQFGSKFKPVARSSSQEFRNKPKTSVASYPSPGKTKISDRKPRSTTPPSPVLVQSDRAVKVPVTAPPTFKPPTTTTQSKLPPIVQGNGQARTSPVSLPPIVQGNSSPQASSFPTPPVIQNTFGNQTRSSAVPPIVRGRKIDPSANVSANEIPLPMAVRSTFDTRTAAWPVNRK